MGADRPDCSSDGCDREAAYQPFFRHPALNAAGVSLSISFCRVCKSRLTLDTIIAPEARKGFLRTITAATGVGLDWDGLTLEWEDVPQRSVVEQAVSLDDPAVIPVRAEVADAIGAIVGSGGEFNDASMRLTLLAYEALLIGYRTFRQNARSSANLFLNTVFRSLSAEVEREYGDALKITTALSTK